MSKLENEIELRQFLVERISAALRIKEKSLDPGTPFALYGLESIDAVIITMEFEEEIGVTLEPTLLWEYNTVNLCASFLHKHISESAVAKDQSSQSRPAASGSAKRR